MRPFAEPENVEASELAPATPPGVVVPTPELTVPSSSPIQSCAAVVGAPHKGQYRDGESARTSVRYAEGSALLTFTETWELVTEFPSPSETIT